MLTENEQRIIDALVERAKSLTGHDAKERNRKHPVAMARKAISLAVREGGGWSYSKIAQSFGHINHTTALHSVAHARQIMENKRTDEDAEFASVANNLIEYYDILSGGGHTENSRARVIKAMRQMGCSIYSIVGVCGK